MAYLVNDNCIKCKHMDCVEVCPVDCFFEGENMLVIDPDICIDCGVCEPECPVDAIQSESAFSPEDAVKWENLNREYSTRWPNITKKREEDVPADAEKWAHIPHKFIDHFSDEPGKGD